MVNRFKKEISDQKNEIRKKLGGVNGKQMSALLLVFDSISRYRLERNLPKTTKFLKELKDNEEFDDTFEFYDFDKTPVPEPVPRTVSNMAQMLYGKTWEEISAIYGSSDRLLKDKVYLKHQTKAIWTHFSKLGYVTMFSHNTVLDYLTFLFGQIINTDHVLTNIWKYFWSVFNIHDKEDGKKCVGNRHINDFSLDYTYQFFDNYPDNHKFAYVHMNAALENTKNAKTIDKYLFRFLTKYLRILKVRVKIWGFYFCLIMAIKYLKALNGTTGLFMKSTLQQPFLLFRKK